ncbi:hypothetical protein ANN_09847 [Periplaneta americana]|uniref:Uncharacterized protein n=1 Tax=Periplaneta americana TaxID=6978 RepID=A0ABQ8TMU9_PERAM|nr:hypothetical protein ANN_09847 [Periplaneta americana]
MIAPALMKRTVKTREWNSRDRAAGSDVKPSRFCGNGANQTMKRHAHPSYLCSYETRAGIRFPGRGHFRQSPDLTPLDYCVWDWYKSEVYKRKVETREELLARIIRACAQVKECPNQLRSATQQLCTRTATALQLVDFLNIYREFKEDIASKYSMSESGELHVVFANSDLTRLNRSSHSIGPDPDLTEVPGTSQGVSVRGNGTEACVMEQSVRKEILQIKEVKYRVIELVLNQTERFKQEEADYDEALRKIKRSQLSKDRSESHKRYQEGTTYEATRSGDNGIRRPWMKLMIYLAVALLCLVMLWMAAVVGVLIAAKRCSSYNDCYSCGCGGG